MMIVVNQLLAVVVAAQTSEDQEDVFQADSVKVDLVKAELLDVDLVVGFGFY